MDIVVGTSGYNYPEWKGTFYPDPFPASKMFAYYAEAFRTVEINYTFYRMPTPKLAEGWRAQAPEGFRYTLKAPNAAFPDLLTGSAGWPFSPRMDSITPLVSALTLALYGLIFGAIVGALFGLLFYAFSGGQRDFTSVGSIRAQRYEIVVDSEVANEAERLLATMGPS